MLLLPMTSYKAEDFLAAAGRLGVEVVAATDRRQALEADAPGHSLAVDYRDEDAGVARIVAFAGERPLDAVVGTDDETVVLAAAASRALGLRHNPPDAVRRTRNKRELREALAAAGLRGPAFDVVPLDGDVLAAAARAAYPCVVKPVGLSASRGVIRADGPAELVAAVERIRAILDDRELSRRGVDTRHVLIESFLPGAEIAVEGVLDRGRLRVLAVFDKPDGLDGPYFEETLFVTPSRHPASLIADACDEVSAGCAALGLAEGPVHAELRLADGRPWLLEIAARTIGGLCARTLRFGSGASLEEIVLRHALGMSWDDLERDAPAAGVLMLPIPRRGTLRRVRGGDDALAVPGVREVTITARPGDDLVPLPEGHRYLGFVFAAAATPAEVESALRAAGERLVVDIRD